MENPGWIKEGLTIAGIGLVGLLTWFWRLVMGHTKRISELEKAAAVANVHLENIEKNIERGVAAIERMEQRHREDIVRAYEHIESLHIVVIEHLAKTNNVEGGK